MEENQNILSLRIKKLRTDAGLTQEELALKLGLKGKSSIANYESGKITPSDEIKIKLCKLFECSIDYLMGNSDFKNPKVALNEYLENQISLTILKCFNEHIVDYVIPCKITEKKLDKLTEILVSSQKGVKIEDIRKQLNEFYNYFPEDKQAKIKEFVKIIIKEIIYVINSFNIAHGLMSLVEREKNELSTNSFYMCPVYGQISAGQPNWAEECIEGRIPIDPDLMNITEPEECFFLRVNGESMNKEIKNGAYALIRKTDVVENGDIAVVLVNGYDATLKKFSKQGDLIILEPLSNDPSFTTQVYGKDTEIKIIGKYIGKMEMK